VSIQQSPITVLTYETPSNSDAKALRLRSWILLGGILYGIADVGSRLTGAIEIWLRDDQDISAPWKWIASAGCSAAIATASLLSLRNMLTTRQVRVTILLALLIDLTIPLTEIIRILLSPEATVYSRYAFNWLWIVLRRGLWPAVMITSLSPRLCAHGVVVVVNIAVILFCILSAEITTSIGHALVETGRIGLPIVQIGFWNVITAAVEVLLSLYCAMLVLRPKWNVIRLMAIVSACTLPLLDIAATDWRDRLGASGAAQIFGIIEWIPSTAMVFTTLIIWAAIETHQYRKLSLAR
jgi:hypothetical protein